MSLGPFDTLFGFLGGLTSGNLHLAGLFVLLILLEMVWARRNSFFSSERVRRLCCKPPMLWRSKRAAFSARASRSSWLRPLTSNGPSSWNPFTRYSRSSPAFASARLLSE